MNFFDVIRAVADSVLGTRGAVDNCRQELVRRVEAERAVASLEDRLGREPAAAVRRPA